MNKIYYYLLAIILILGAGGFVYANPGYFSQGVTTVALNSTATTSVSYMSPGNATTTTNVYDAYADGANTKADAAVLLVQFTASSSLSTLNMAVEYSNGIGCATNPNGCDWYQNNLNNFGGFNIASTSNTVNNTISVVNVQDLSWKFASSSVGGGAVLANNNRVNKVISIPTPARFVRVVFSCALGGTNCGVWGHLVPNKEQSY